MADRGSPSYPPCSDWFVCLFVRSLGGLFVAFHIVFIYQFLALLFHLIYLLVSGDIYLNRTLRHLSILSSLPEEPLPSQHLAVGALDVLRTIVAADINNVIFFSIV